MEWPKRCWTMLLQTVLSGKAQETYAALPAEDCTDYDIVKAAILKNYKLVPEAYSRAIEKAKVNHTSSLFRIKRDSSTDVARRMLGGV